jgi:hypothetical protein
MLPLVVNKGDKPCPWLFRNTVVVFVEKVKAFLLGNPESPRGDVE